MRKKKVIAGDADISRIVVAVDYEKELQNREIIERIFALAYLALRKKGLYVPLFIIILTELLQMLKAIPYLDAGPVQNLQVLGIIFRSNLLYALIYALLSATGMAVAFLLIYAFRREKNE